MQQGACSEVSWGGQGIFSLQAAGKTDGRSGSSATPSDSQDGRLVAFERSKGRVQSHEELKAFSHSQALRKRGRRGGSSDTPSEGQAKKGVSWLVHAREGWRGGEPCPRPPQGVKLSFFNPIMKRERRC